jgi:ribosomal protein S20
MKKIIAVVATAGLLVAGTAGLASAADSPDALAQDRVAGKGRRIAGALKVAATAIGVEPQALRAAVRDGDSVADVAESHAVAPQAVVDAIVAAANTKIDEAVAAGRIDAERAAAAKARLPERISKLVESDLKGRRHARAKIRRHVRRSAFVVAADVIGVEPKALGSAVRDGESMAAVATSHDVDPQAVIDAVVAKANAKIDRAVDAGRIEADRAGTVKDRMVERITKLVNATPRERGAAPS